MELHLDPQKESPMVLRAFAALFLDIAQCQEEGRPIGGGVPRLNPAEAAALDFSRRIQKEQTSAVDPLTFLHPDELKFDNMAQAQRAAPLPPPAPSIAAATLFPTAPVAPQAGAVPPPPAPSPPAATSPTADAAPVNPAPVAPAPLLDKRGLPWDHRIHSGTRALNADGTWRSRRGLNDPALLERVEAELRAVQAIPGPVAPASAVPLPPSATVPDAPIATAQVTTAVTPPLVTASAPRVPMPPIPAPSSFALLMTTVSSSITAGKLTQTQVRDVLVAHGAPPDAIGTLATRPDVAAAVLATLQGMLV